MSSIDSKILRHEAGHVLFAIGFGWTVNQCQVQPEPSVDVALPLLFSESDSGTAIWGVVSADQDSISKIDCVQLGKLLSEPSAIIFSVQAICFLMSGDLLEHEDLENGFLRSLCNSQGRAPHSDGSKIGMLDKAWGATRSGAVLSNKMFHSVYKKIRDPALQSIGGMIDLLTSKSCIADPKVIRDTIICDKVAFNHFQDKLDCLIPSLVKSISDSEIAKDPST